jgi:hypothetical protein
MGKSIRWDIGRSVRIVFYSVFYKSDYSKQLVVGCTYVENILWLNVKSHAKDSYNTTQL